MISKNRLAPKSSVLHFTALHLSCFGLLFLIFVATNSHAQSGLTQTKQGDSKSKLPNIRFPAKDTGIEWHSVEPGYDIARIQLGKTAYLISSELLLIRISPKYFDFKIVRAKDYSAQLLSIRELTDKSKAIIGINTHFFDPQGEPLGLLVRNGKTEHRVQLGGSVLTGVFSLNNNNKPKIYHRSIHSQQPQAKIALQAGPRLIERSKKVPLKTKSSTSRRSGIAVTKDGDVLLFATFLRFPGASLEQIQAFLMRPELKVVDALNLDGGGSSQLFVVSNSASQGDIFISGGDPIPVGLLVKKRVRKK